MAEIYEGAVDKGLEGVVACTTGISSIVDATLCFRGYTIEDLAAHSTFEEVVYLLWYDRLPNEQEFKEFSSTLHKEMALRDDLVTQLSSLPRESVHPMSWLRTAVSMLALWDPDANGQDQQSRDRIALRLTAKVGSLVALFERLRQGKSYVSPNPEKVSPGIFCICLQELSQMLRLKRFLIHV